MNESQMKVAMLYISVGVRVLSARAALFITLFLAFALFAWAMWNLTIMSIACATIFAILVYWPTIRIDRSMKADRAVISPENTP